MAQTEVIWGEPAARRFCQGTFEFKLFMIASVGQLGSLPIRCGIQLIHLSGPTFANHLVQQTAHTQKSAEIESHSYSVSTGSVSCLQVQGIYRQMVWEEERRGHDLQIRSFQPEIGELVARRSPTTPSYCQRRVFACCLGCHSGTDGTQGTQECTL